MKSQTPSTKLQTNLKFQYQMTKTGLEFLITAAGCQERGKTTEAAYRILYFREGSGAA
jgi:hypothetical protein